jgi:hypothetical protein
MSIKPSPCASRDALNQHLAETRKQANLAGKNLLPYTFAPYSTALTRLQAHIEICHDCQAAFQSSFPELDGKVMVYENLSKTYLYESEER